MAESGVVVLVPVLALLGAVLYSLRGGMISELIGRDIGTQCARLTWAMPFGAHVGATMGMPLWSWPITMAVAFATMLLPHGTAQGREGVRYGWEDAMDMASVGMLRSIMFMPVILFVLDDLPWNVLMLIAGGTLTGLAYWLGWRTPWSLVMTWRGKRTVLRLGLSTEWGEAYTGAFWYAFPMAGWALGLA